MLLTANKRIALIALAIILLDQVTKQIVLRTLEFRVEEKVIIDGFFKFVHWGNTGAAWSVMSGNNELLAIVSLFALLLLFLYRHHFNSKTLTGQCALGLIFGGIVGNLIDRLFVKHVIDFLYFYVYKKSGIEAGFPAFNIADMAICTGVGLLFLISWQNEYETAPQEASPAK
ncbi:MAG: signal peptidase II [Verrucomicrobiota bacterium]|nr:signal peptidase II [Verrucomicrobiota bacterium]